MGAQHHYPVNLPAHVVELGVPVELEAVLAYPVEELEDLHAGDGLAADDVADGRGLGHALHQAVGEVARGGGGRGREEGGGRQQQRRRHHCSDEATAKGK